MTMINKDGQKVYFYEICDHDGSFWVYSTDKYSNEEFEEIIGPIRNKHEKEIEDYRLKSIELFNQMNLGEITKEEYEAQSDYLDDNESPFGGEISLKKILEENHNMTILKPQASGVCSMHAW